MQPLLAIRVLRILLKHGTDSELRRVGIEDEWCRHVRVNENWRGRECFLDLIEGVLASGVHSIGAPFGGEPFCRSVRGSASSAKLSTYRAKWLARLLNPRTSVIVRGT